jgi:predicted RNA-binding protein with PUA-like domain
VLFYHSNTKVPGVYALAEVAKEGYPDYTAWDASHPYHDAKSDKDKPTW